MESRGEEAWRDSGEGRTASWNVAAHQGELGRDWQSGSLASRLVVRTVAVRRQQAADNLQETDKLDMYTKRRQSNVLVTVTKAVAWEI